MGIEKSDKPAPTPEQPVAVAEKHSSPGQERSYVAAILEDNNLIEDIINDDLAMLTVPEYRHIVGHVLQLYNEGWHKIDRYSVVNLAEKSPRVAEVLMKMGGIEALERICSYQMATINFAKNREELRQLYAKRQFITGLEKQYQQAKASAESLSIEELMKQADDTLTEVNSRILVVNDYSFAAPDEDEFIAEAERALAAGFTFSGVPTNMHPYDEMFGGFGKGRLHVFGAPTGCGKSLLSVNWSLSMAYGMLPTDRQYKVCVIDSGELMKWDDWFPRLLAAHSGVRTKSIQRKWFARNAGEKEAIRQSLRAFKANPIIWKQMTDFDAQNIKAFIRRIVKREGAEIILFDNVKINPNWTKGEDPYLKLGHMVQAMKDAAIEMGVPVVAFIQLTSDGTVTGRKKLGMTEPHVSMFAGGQRILQNTDIGGVLDFEDYDDPSNDNRKLIIQKARNDRSHRPGEFMRCIGDLRRSHLVVVENILKSALDDDGSGYAPKHTRIIDPATIQMTAESDPDMMDDFPFERWDDVPAVDGHPTPYKPKGVGGLDLF